MAGNLEKFTLGYSNKGQYQLKLIESIEHFIRRVRWKAYFVLNPNVSSKQKETYGFNSTVVPPVCKELKLLEDGLIEISANMI